MALTPNLNPSSSIIFLIIPLLIFSLPHLPHTNATTSLLNVTEALNQAHQLLSLKPKTLQHQPPPSSSFSLQLHPRDSLFNYKHYRSLVLARLTRDSARVKHIFSELTHVTNPSKPELRPETLSAPVKSGVSSGSGDYFTRIGVGQPSRNFYMILDTGSDLSWLQCKPCSLCYLKSDPIFDPSTSSSYARLPCEAKQCHQLEMSSCHRYTNHYCEYRIVYGDGSYSIGGLVTETMSFGNNSVNKVVMGCGHVNQGLFMGTAGVLGLGGGPLSLTSQINATSFSYCLVDRDTDKSSTLEFNSPPPGDSVTTRLLKNPKLSTFYYVELTGVSVGGKSVPVPKSTFEIDGSGHGGVIVDSGTAVTRLQREAYVAVRDAFVALTQHLPRAMPFSLLDTCYDLSSMKAVTVPTVSFEMRDGRSWKLPAKGYLIPVDTEGTFCFAFAPTMSQLSIIGNVQQQGTRVSFDLAKSVVGFSSFKC